MLITKEQLEERNINRTFRLDGFTLYACEPTAEESRNDLQRDHITIVIFAKGEDKGLVVPVGSPIIMTRGKSWDECAAARSALSFASEPSCWDDTDEQEWSRDNDLCCIDYLVSRAIGRRIGRHGGIVCGGCGMDMGFELVYTLGLTLWPNGTPKPHGKRNGQPDRDGGYALKHDWL